MISSKKLVLLIVFLIFLIRSIFAIDPDFWWHIRFGQIILEQGLPLKDPFSYTMPSYMFINHEWLTDIVLYFLYTQNHFLLAVLFSCIATTALYLASIANKTHFSLLIPLGAIALVSLVGVRPQVLSWLYFAMVLYMLFKPQMEKKANVLLPILFLLWANTHGGFPMGIILITVVLGYKTLVGRKIYLHDSLMLLFCILVTSINPYGFHLWTEILKSAQDASLRWTVAEWLPGFTYTNIAFWLYVAFSTVLISRYRKSIKPLSVILYAVFFILAMSSVRHIPFWLLVSFFTTSEALSLFKKEMRKIPFAQKKLKKVQPYLIVIFAAILLGQTGFTLYQSYDMQESRFYPKKAMQYLTAKATTGNIFTVYEWGGYTIWHLPGKKVFIDGRMPSWSQQPRKNESSHVYQEYRMIMSGEQKIDTILPKYNITSMLLPTKKTYAENDFQRLKKIIRVQTKPDLPTQLSSLKWTVVYQDSIATIYESPKK